MVESVGKFAEIYDVWNLRKNSICRYAVFTGPKQKRERPICNKVNGVLSWKSKRRIIRCAENWVQCIEMAIKASILPFKIGFSFLTLTIPIDPPTNSDRLIKAKCLNPFFTELKKRCGGALNYIWRAEVVPKYSKKKERLGIPNEAQGRLHFHIIIDRYIPKHLIQSIWNRMLDRLKLVSNSKWANPNTVFISTIYKLQQVTSYIVKYISKDNELERSIDGKQWGASDSIINIDNTLKITELYCPNFYHNWIKFSGINKMELDTKWADYWYVTEEYSSIFWELLELDSKGITETFNELCLNNYKTNLLATHQTYIWLK